MKFSELYQKPLGEATPCISCETPPEEDNEEFYDENDFWEAIDLLTSARKVITKLSVLHDDAIGTHRLHMLTRLCDDIGNFVGNFIETDTAKVIDVTDITPKE